MNKGEDSDRCEGCREETTVLITMNTTKIKISTKFIWNQKFCNVT